MHSRSTHFPIPRTKIDNLSIYERISDVQSSILKDLKFLGYYAITLYQRGIAFYATKDGTEGTSAKTSQFLKSFQGIYFLLSI
jgi:hypothetical protein